MQVSSSHLTFWPQDTMSQWHWFFSCFKNWIYVACQVQDCLERDVKTRTPRLTSLRRSTERQRRIQCFVNRTLDRLLKERERIEKGRNVCHRVLKLDSMLWDYGFWLFWSYNHYVITIMLYSYGSDIALQSVVWK